MTKFTFDENVFSDLYKEVYYSRPRNHEFFDPWTTDERKQEIWDNLLDLLEIENDLEERRKENALKAFKEKIESTMELGAEDTKTAIRWIFEAEGFEYMDYTYGASYACYHFGLCYRNEYVGIFDEVAHEKVCGLYQEEAA